MNLDDTHACTLKQQFSLMLSLKWDELLAASGCYCSTIISLRQTTKYELLRQLPVFSNTQSRAHRASSSLSSLHTIQCSVVVVSAKWTHCQIVKSFPLTYQVETDVIDVNVNWRHWLILSFFMLKSVGMSIRKWRKLILSWFKFI